MAAWGGPAGGQQYPGRNNQTAKSNKVGGIEIVFQFSMWDDSTAEKAVEFIKGDRNYGWQTTKMQICVNPKTKSAWHEGGRPGDANADPNNHATVRCYAKDGKYLTTFHVQPSGYGTGYKPSRIGFTNTRNNTRNPGTRGGMKGGWGGGGMGTGNRAAYGQTARDETDRDMENYRNRIKSNWRGGNQMAA